MFIRDAGHDTFLARSKGKIHFLYSLKEFPPDGLLCQTLAGGKKLAL